MDVVDFLAAMGLNIKDQSVASFGDTLCPGEVASSCNQLPCKIAILILEMVDGWNVFFGNNQHVRRSLRVNIMKSDQVVCF